MGKAGKTPFFRGPDNKVLPGSIAEAGFRRIGGVDQWVMIRGEDVSNPALIMLHGGPGLSETSLFRYFNAPLEKAFTVVYWDQRGAGRSYRPDLSRESMTLERFVTDLDELVTVVCTRLDKTSVGIFGHSWGSALGPIYASRHPGRVGAYAGSGQIGDWAAAERDTYEFALAEARRLGRKKAIGKLRAIGPPPHSAEELWVQRSQLSRLEGGMKPKALWKMARAALSGGETSIFDLRSGLRGFRFSLDAMWAEVSTIDLGKLAPRLALPTFFFLGRRDHWVSPANSLAYIDALDAPSKQVVWFEESGHEPFVDEPNRFNDAMRDLVRPVLTAA